MSGRSRWGGVWVLAGCGFGVFVVLFIGMGECNTMGFSWDNAFWSLQLLSCRLY
jgi:hypothetical protein